MFNVLSWSMYSGIFSILWFMLDCSEIYAKSHTGYYYISYCKHVQIYLGERTRLVCQNNIRMETPRSIYSQITMLPLGNLFKFIHCFIQHLYHFRVQYITSFINYIGWLTITWHYKETLLIKGKWSLCACLGGHNA